MLERQREQVKKGGSVSKLISKLDFKFNSL